MKLVKEVDRIDKKKIKVSEEQAEEAIRTIIQWIGEDPEREGLKSTPKRVVKAFKEYFNGYTQDPKNFLSKTFTEVEGYDDMVIEKNISIQSHCEHHMAPIIGVAHVAYIPSKNVVGLSKLARVVEAFSKRLQTQETMTQQISEAIEQSLRPKGVAVYIEAFHQCMTTRGVLKPNVSTITNTFLGDFKTDLNLQKRFMDYIINR